MCTATTKTTGTKTFRHKNMYQKQEQEQEAMSDILTAAFAELTELFERKQNELDPWASDNYQYDDGYISGLAKAIAIIESHMQENQ